ncbi:MAG: hypothetical protein V1815_00765 [Candidatus Woesearchaeota archaeon]
MKYNEYLQLMKSVSDFGKKSDLNTDNLYKNNYTPTDHEKWVISVSWKTSIDNSDILYSSMDEYKPDFDKSLKFPIVVGSKEQIKSYEKKAEEQDAEYFSKKSIAFDGFIQPSSEFLALNTVEQVEYALHEAFHNTPKLFFGKEQAKLFPEYEEASAFVIGHIGSIHYFNETELKPQAIAHLQKHLNLANLVNRFYNELEEVLSFRAGTDKKPISQEQKMIDREKLLEKARKELGNNLGGPINNAFFVYWNYFYGKVGKMYGKIRDLNDFKKIVLKMKTFDKW